jgi:hypothetical protein
MRTSDNDCSVSDNNCSVSDNDDNNYNDNYYYNNYYYNNDDACAWCLPVGSDGSWWWHHLL